VRDHPEGKQTKHTPEGELGTEVTINTGRPLVGSNNLARGAEPGDGPSGRSELTRGAWRQAAVPE
jgi:hypothetical protein